MTADQTTETVIARHVAAFVAGDVEAIIADYAEDAVMLTKGTGVIRGKAAIASTFQAIFTHLLPPATTRMSFEPLIVSGEIALQLFSATTPTVRTVGGFDTFVVRDGLIVAQTGGGEFVPV